MKRVRWMVIGCLLAGTVCAEKIPEPKVVKVTDRLYALLGPMDLPNKHNQGYMVNTTLLVGDQEAILVDSGFSDEIGSHLARTVAKITSKPIRHVINTHSHGDHMLGNSAFKKAEIISSEETRTLVRKEGYEWVEMIEHVLGRKLPHTVPVPASVTFQPESRTERTIQGVRMVFIVPPGSHIDGDMMIYLPDEKVLISGDVVVNGIVPNFRDAHVKAWIGTLASIQQMDIKTIIPGHGPLMTQADVSALQRRMEKFYAAVEEGYKKGLSDSEIRATLDLSEWKKLGNFEEQMGNNINRAYLEVEATNF